MNSGMPTSSRKNARCKCKCYKLFFARWNPCYNVYYIFARTFNSRKTMKISFLHFNAKNWSGEGAEVRPNGAEVLLFHLFLEFVNIVFSMCHAMQSSESLLWSISKILTPGLLYAEVVANCAKVKRKDTCITCKLLSLYAQKQKCCEITIWLMQFKRFKLVACLSVPLKIHIVRVSVKQFFDLWGPRYHGFTFPFAVSNSGQTIKILFWNLDANNWSWEGAEVRPNGAEVLAFPALCLSREHGLPLYHAMQSRESLLWSKWKRVDLSLWTPKWLWGAQKSKKRSM